MTVLGWIAFGLVVGIVAKLLTRVATPVASSSPFFSALQAPCLAVSSVVRPVGTAKAIR